MTNSKDPREAMMERISKADPKQLEGFIRMFDRVLLYSMASSMFDDDQIEACIGSWTKLIKNIINEDAKRQTELLEGSPSGRLAKYMNQPDGEDVRLWSLRTHKLAEDIIRGNIMGGRHPEDNYSIE